MFRPSFKCILISVYLLTSVTANAQEDARPAMSIEALSKLPLVDRFISQFNEQCAVCHGEDLRGAALGTPLVGVDLLHGNSVEDIANAGLPAAIRASRGHPVDVMRAPTT